MNSQKATYFAVASAQLLMAKELPIQPDGKWGAYTQSAYERVSPRVKAQVDELVYNLLGQRPADLYIKRKIEKSTTMIDTSSIRSIIASVATKEGVPISTALKIANLESRFNPNAISPTGAKGLFQLTGIAIKDLADRGGYHVDASKIFDPVENSTAGMKYIKLVAHDLGASLADTATIYMGFNIGPTGAKHVLAGNPLLASAAISLQAYGSPVHYADNLRAAVMRA